MKNYEENFQEKLAEAKLKLKDQSVNKLNMFLRLMQESIDLSFPYLENLNEDPVLNGKVKYSLKNGKLLVGRKNMEPPNDIVLGGLGILAYHAEVIYQDQVYIENAQNDNNAHIYVNGTKISERTILKPFDRIILGHSAIFM